MQKLLTFFSKKFQHICISLDVNFNESLTNDIVSFEQLGPEIYLISPVVNWKQKKKLKNFTVLLFFISSTTSFLKKGTYVMLRHL